MPHKYVPWRNKHEETEWWRGIGLQRAGGSCSRAGRGSISREYKSLWCEESQACSVKDTTQRGCPSELSFFATALNNISQHDVKTKLIDLWSDLHLRKKQSADHKWPYGDLTSVLQLLHAWLSHDFTSTKALAGFLIRNQVAENFLSDADVFVQENYSKKFDWAQKGKWRSIEVKCKCFYWI